MTDAIRRGGPKPAAATRATKADAPAAPAGTQAPPAGWRAKAGPANDLRADRLARSSRAAEANRRLGGDAVGAAAPAGRGPRAGGPAATAYDVTDDAALAKLSASANPADREVADLMKAARMTYAALLERGAKLSVIAGDAGNSGQPVLCLVPKALVQHPRQAFDTQVHYQGMNGTPGRPDPASGLPAKLGAQLDGPPPRVFLLPAPVELRRGTFPDWSCVKDTRQTADLALEAAGLRATGGAAHPLVVSGHSAGGRALAVAQGRGGLDCNRLELQDCLYGVPAGRPDSAYASARDAALAWAKANPGKALVYVRSKEGGNGEDLTAPDLPAGARFTRVVVQRHYDADLPRS